MNVLRRLRLTPRQQQFWSMMFFIVLVFCVFYNSLAGEFIGDDNVLIVQNKDIADVSWAGFGCLFTRSFFDITTADGRPLHKQDSYYRPLVIASFMLDYAVWHVLPFGYHLTNVILHALTGMLLFMFLRTCSGNILFPLLTTTLFLIHPLHARHVAAIAGRTDLLCLVFYLLTLVCYQGYHTCMRRLSKGLLLASALLSFLASLLAKEMAVTLPLILILYDRCFHYSAAPDTGRTCVRVYGLFFIVLLLYIVIRQQVVSVDLSEFLHATFTVKPFTRLFTVAHIFVTHLRSMLLPYPSIQFGSYYVPLITVPWLQAAVSGGALIVVLVLSLYLSWQRNRLFFFGLSWLGLTYVPVSNIVPLYTGIAEYNLFIGKQFLHFPLIGFSIMIVSFFIGIIAGIPQPTVRTVVKRIMLWLFIVVGLAGCLEVSYYNLAWSDAGLYYTMVGYQNPLSVEAHNDLGIEYAKRGLYAKAIELFADAIIVQERQQGRIKNIPQPYINLLRLLAQERQYDTVFALSQRMRRLFPDHYMAYYYAGVATEARGEHADARYWYQHALRYNPSSRRCAVALGRVVRAVRE